MDEISKEVTALLAGSQHFRVRKRRMTLETGVSGVGPRVLVVSHGLTFINRNSEAVAAGFWLLK